MLRRSLAGRIFFPKIVQQQYVGKAGKSETDVLQVNSIYYVPYIIAIGRRL